MRQRRKILFAFISLVLLGAVCLAICYFGHDSISVSRTNRTPFVWSCIETVDVIVPCYANGDEENNLETYIGRLFVKTERVGTRSEGPEYYLTLEDGTEIHVIKNANLWEKDPMLQGHVDRDVWISGNVIEGELLYESVGDLGSTK